MAWARWCRRPRTASRPSILVGLDWAVKQRSVKVDGRVVEGYKANVRATDGKVLGIVGTRYSVLQNREAFNFTDALLGEGVRYETAGALFGGKQVWILAKLPDDFRLVGDPVTTYLLFTNRHDGLGTVKAAVVPVRVVCNNTLQMAMKGVLRSWSTRHTGSVKDKVAEAARSLGMARTYMAELGKLADALAAKRLPPDSWSDLVAELMPVPKDASPTTVNRIDEQRGALRKLMLAPDLNAHRWTAWGAINAVADYADHSEPVRKVRGWEERRFAAVAEGRELVDKALELLLK